MIIDKGDVAVKSIISRAGPGDVKLLEIGCGDGRLTCGLHAEYGNLVAIDPDEASIKRAQEKYPRIDFRVGSGESLRFADEVFDVVLFSLSLHHHQSGAKALKQVERVLAEKGKVLVLEPSLDSRISQVCNIFEDESDALIKAMECIRNCRFTVVSERSVSTKWVFQDRYELYEWLFDYYNLSSDPVKIESVDNFLGEHINVVPVSISDTLSLTELSL